MSSRGIDSIVIAKSWAVDLDVAARWLIEIYPALTLAHYDCGDPSPLDGVDMQDLGRVLIFGGFRGFKAATKLLERSPGAAWPEPPADWRLDAEPNLSVQEWLSSPPVEAAKRLFGELSGGLSLDGRVASTSKVLHLKWPEFFPIPDSNLRTTYWSVALDRELAQVRSRSRTRPTVPAFWLVVREDLLDAENQAALTALRKILRDTPSSPKVACLRSLSTLRLLDCLAWGISDNDYRLAATAVS